MEIRRLFKKIARIYLILFFFEKVLLYQKALCFSKECVGQLGQEVQKCHTEDATYSN